GPRTASKPLNRNRGSSGEMAKRRSLGRGLKALLSTASAHAPAVADDDADASAPSVEGAAHAPAARAEDTLRELPIDLLHRAKHQRRTNRREKKWAEHAESLRAQGIVQPIVVRPIPGRDSGGEVRYELIAGDRRWRAAQLAGLDVVPAVIRDIP